MGEKKEERMDGWMEGRKKKRMEEKFQELMIVALS
jgi:hypothetical protein